MKEREWERQADGTGGRDRRSEDGSAQEKNKNPTQSCGEKPRSWTPKNAAEHGRTTLIGPFPYPLQGLRNPPKDFQSGNITGMLKTLQDQFVTVRLHAWLATRAGLQHLVCLGFILPGIAGFWIAIFGASGPVFDSSSLKNITLLDVQSARSFELFQLEIVIFWIPVELSWLARRLVVLAFHLWFRFRMLPGEARAGKGRNVTWWRRTEVVSRKGIGKTWKNTSHYTEL